MLHKTAAGDAESGDSSSYDNCPSCSRRDIQTESQIQEHLKRPLRPPCFCSKWPRHDMSAAVKCTRPRPSTRNGNHLLEKLIKLLHVDGAILVTKKGRRTYHPHVFIQTRRQGIHLDTQTLRRNPLAIYACMHLRNTTVNNKNQQKSIAAPTPWEHLQGDLRHQLSRTECTLLASVNPFTGAIKRPHLHHDQLHEHPTSAQFAAQLNAEPAHER